MTNNNKEWNHKTPINESIPEYGKLRNKNVQIDSFLLLKVKFDLMKNDNM